MRSHFVDVEINGHKRKFRLTFDYPPIPIRDMDWSAIDEDRYDGEGSPIGHGKTEEEAIADLIEQIEDRIESGKE